MKLTLAGVVKHYKSNWFFLNVQPNYLFFLYLDFCEINTYFDITCCLNVRHSARKLIPPSTKCK